MADSAGTDRVTGVPLLDWQHVRQSIGVILTTAIGTRAMRRDFGSEVPDLIGRPMTTLTILQLYAASYLALLRWEPRFALNGIQIVEASASGRIGLRLSGTYNPTGHLEYDRGDPVAIPDFTVFF
jgi:phage baseplate assembly protein W